MNPLVVGGIVVAVVAVALALQVLARVLQGLPLDQRRADPLIDVSSRATGSMRPAELHQLTSTVTNAVLSDAAYRSELVPLLDQLGAPSDEQGGRRPGARVRRSDRIEEAVSALEARWGIGDPDAGPR